MASKLVPGTLKYVIKRTICIRSPRVTSICGEDFELHGPFQATESSSVGWPSNAEHQFFGSSQHTYASIRNSFNILESHNLKVIIIGDAYTGKSALLELFAKGRYSYNTQGAASGNNTVIKYRDNYYVINFWDRPDSGLLLDRMDNDCKEFYEDADAALVVYDLTRLPDTLPNAMKWKERVDSFVCKKPGESIPMFLLGNKCDLDQCYHDGNPFTELHGFKGHFRTSAINRAGIDRALEMLVREVLNDYP